MDEPVYPVLTRAKTLRLPTDDGRVIRDVALELWDAAKIAEPVRLLGVSVSQLSAAQQSQLDLFTENTRPKRQLGAALDAIRERFGRDAIGPAVGRFEKVTPEHEKKTRRMNLARELGVRPVSRQKYSRSPLVDRESVRLVQAATRTYGGAPV